MYFAIAKITFEEELGADNLRPGTAGKRDLHQLVEKIRAKFKVCAAAIESDSMGSDAIAITALGSSEDRLTRSLDGILGFCEESGYGRVGSEETLIDHIDVISEHDRA